MANEKIEKILEELDSLTILELADLVKALEEEFGVSAAAMADVTGGAEEINGIKVFSAVLAGTVGDGLRKAGDDLKSKNDSFIAVLAGHADGKGNFLCICSKEAIEKGANAGQIVKQIAAIAGGKGGGKPDSAMGGGKDPSKMDEALNSVADFVATKVK